MRLYLDTNKIKKDGILMLKIFLIVYCLCQSQYYPYLKRTFKCMLHCHFLKIIVIHLTV